MINKKGGKKVKIKKTVLHLFIALLTFGICSEGVKAIEYENYFGIQMTNTQYNNLLNQGFSEDEIYYMSEDTFNRNKDLTASLAAVTSKYYKSIYTDLNGNPQTVEISKSEYDNESSNQIRGYVETEYKRMDAYITYISNSYYRYKVTTKWKNMPSVRSYDIIGLAFEDDEVAMRDTTWFQYNYCVSSGSCYVDGTYYHSEEDENGGSTVYKFPSNAVSMTATLYFDVVKNTTAIITRQAIHGDYAHAITPVDYDIYSIHNMTTGGLALGSSSQYYDAIPCADTGWTGSW